MAWKDDMVKRIDDQTKMMEYQDLLIQQMHERLFYAELALKAIIKIITVDQKFLSPKEYTNVVDKVYKELSEEMKKRQAEEALAKKQ